ncbi:MAG: type II toxin-antitoxin system HicA family toxin [Paraclostridium sp.]
MENNILYKISKNIINSILLDGFDCTEATAISENGIEYNEDIDMHTMVFIINDESLGKGTYISMLIGDYTSCNNKFYPFYITTYNINNKNDCLKIDIQELVACMIDMDNIYNRIAGSNILTYEFMRINKDYIVIFLNEANKDCFSSKFKKFILLSEDKETGKLIVELAINESEKVIVFETTDPHQFYKYLESEALKLLITKDKKDVIPKKDRIEESVNTLLDIGISRLEDDAIKIQTEELIKASDLLFEQYEYNYAILDELYKVINEKSDIEKVSKLVEDGLEKKMYSIEFFERKTYLYKPRDYMFRIFEGLKTQDDIYNEIDSDIVMQVKNRFLRELDLFQYEVLHPQIIKQSKIFVKEIEELNAIVDEIKELCEMIKSNNINKIEALKLIEAKREKIKSFNSGKLRSTYKTLHKFAKHIGFQPIRQNGTSHLIYKKNSISVPIPNKNGDIKPGLLLTIIKQLCSTREEFYKFTT